MAGTRPTCHLCRLQHSVTLLQQQSEEQRLLLQTLRAELHVYESLPGPSAETRAGMGPMHSIPAQLLLLGCLAPLQPLAGPRHFCGSRLHIVALLAGREEGQDPRQDFLGTEPHLSTEAQTFLVPGCFPSPPVRDVGTNSAAPHLSPLPSSTSVLRQMDGGYQSLPACSPQGLLRSDELEAASLLSKLESSGHSQVPRMGQGVTAGAGSGPHLTQLAPQSHVGQMCW